MRYAPKLLAITQAIFLQTWYGRTGNRHRAGSPNRILIHKGFRDEFTSTFPSFLASCLLKDRIREVTYHQRGSLTNSDSSKTTLFD